jgi:hypothetical protein
MKTSTYIASTLALLLAAPSVAFANDPRAQTSAGPGQNTSQTSTSEKRPSQQAAPTNPSTPLAIMELQRALAARNLYEGDVDGLWGPKTHHALLNFQVQNDLNATGQLNPETERALGVASGRSGAQASHGPGSATQPQQASERQNVSGRDDSASKPGGSTSMSASHASAPPQPHEQRGKQTSSPAPAQAERAFARGTDAGPSTRIRLEALNTGQTRELQQRLQRLGYYRGDLDGKSGDSTRSALQQYFQHQADLARQGFISSSAIGSFGTNVNELQPVSGRDDSQSSPGGMADPSKSQSGSSKPGSQGSSDEQRGNQSQNTADKQQGSQSPGSSGKPGSSSDSGDSSNSGKSGNPGSSGTSSSSGTSGGSSNSGKSGTSSNSGDSSNSGKSGNPGSSGSQTGSDAPKQ